MRPVQGGTIIGFQPQLSLQTVHCAGLNRTPRPLSVASYMERGGQDDVHPGLILASHSPRTCPGPVLLPVLILELSLLSLSP